jgi:DNA-binding response OmpR family regulator
VPTGGVLQVGPLTLNTAEYAVGKEGRRLKLSVTEFKLLHHLMINAGQVVRTAALLRQVWGYEDADAAEVVRVALHRACVASSRTIPPGRGSCTRCPASASC